MSGHGSCKCHPTHSKDKAEVLEGHTQCCRELGGEPEGEKAFAFQRGSPLLYEGLGALSLLCSCPVCVFKDWAHAANIKAELVKNH